MPLTLTAIDPNELAEFLEHIRPQYIDERMHADHLSSTEAEQFVATQWKRTLSAGADTPGHRFFWASESTGTGRVGLLWIFVDSADGHAFINEIIVFEAFRGRGYGRELLALAENVARDGQARTIALNVFMPNSTAIALYERAGFAAVSQHMNKVL